MAMCDGETQKKIGIVFAGGGGKGAYEIGVWKAISEAGIQPDAIAGTSVGALNAALMLQGDRVLAENMWRHIEARNVLSLDPASISPTVLPKLASLSVDLAKLPLAVRTRGLFRQDGLRAMMDEALQEVAVAEAAADFFACVHEPKTNQVHYLRVNGQPKDRVRSILMASCALPLLFSDIEIDGRIYTDGGWFWGVPHKRLDNTPVRPVYEAGCRTIILVCLSRDDLVNRDDFPGVTLLPIVPRENLGDTFDGTLDFSNVGAARRIEQGYRDAKRILDRIEDFTKNEAAYASLWNELSASEARLPQQLDAIGEAGGKRINIRQAIEQFDKAVLDDKLAEPWDAPILPERDLLTAANRNLLKQVDRKELQQRVEDYLAKNLDNSTDIIGAVTEAAAYLAPQEGQARHLTEQGFLARMWSALTGKNIALVAQNQLDLAKAQLAAVTLLEYLQRKNLLTFEMTVTLHNRVNRIFAEVADLHGEINAAYVDVYRSLVTVFFKLRREMMRDRERIDGLEDRVQLMEWLTRIGVHSFGGREYRLLPPPVQLLCVVNDFFRYSGGSWSVRELLTLKQALLTLQLENKFSNIEEVTTALQGNQQLATRLVDGLEAAGGTALQQQTFPGLLSAGGTSAGKTLPIPFFNLAVELLGALKSCGYQVATTSVDAAKATYLARLDELERLADEYSLSAVSRQELAELHQAVARFRLTVPLIGSFSCGKSSLLNRYMGADLLPTDLPPETAIATELHPAAAGNEKIVMHGLDGSNREYPLSELEHLNDEPGQTLYRELHIASSTLARRPDVILVDMPGLDSNIAAHNKAILNYIREGVSFLVCTEARQPLTGSVMDFMREVRLYELDFSVLLTKSELCHPRDLPDLMKNAAETAASFADRAVWVGRVSAHEGDLADFHEAVDRLDAAKEAALARKFEAPLARLTEKVRQNLSFLRNEENLSTVDLQKKKQELENALAEIERMLEQEGRRLRQECRTVLVDGVASDVRAVLVQTQESLMTQIKKGYSVEGRLQGIVQNTLQLSIQTRAQAAFEQAAARVSRYVARSEYSSAIGGSGIDADIMPVAGASPAGSALTSAGGAIVGLILLGPIGAIIGAALAWLFSSRAKDREIREQLQAAFVEIEAGVRNQATLALTDMTERFLAVLATKVGEVRQDRLHNIGLLTEQLRQNNEVSAERKRKIKETLAGLPAASRLPGKGAGQLVGGQ